MNLQIRAVQLRSSTNRGAWGRLVTFQPGFNVLSGANSRGKTQVVQAVIYALGLERMLQTRANAPLGSALTSELRTGDLDDDPIALVERSWVAVEFTGHGGRVITAQRHVKHDRIQNDLVRVWSGPALTDPGVAATPPTEMFLHRPGSATHHFGFHKFLADALGWTLPEVPTYTGSMTLLYPDVLFPFLIVDQQSWGSTSPRKVDRYQIREPLRRAAEFLLGLMGPEAEARRAELELTMAALRTRWAESRIAVHTLAQSVGGRTVGIPQHPAGAQARAAAPEPTSLEGARIEVLQNEEWTPAEEVMAALVVELESFDAYGARRIPPGVDDRTRQELDDVRSDLADLLAAARLVENDLSMEEAQMAALDRRLSMLEEERARNTDIRTLVRLGSEVATTHLADHNCPTCRQSLDAVEVSSLGPALNVDETLSLLNAQISTAQKMRGRSQEAMTQASSAYAAMQRQSDQMRAAVRALEEDLLAPSGAPSAGDITRRVTAQLRLDELRRLSTAVQEQLEELTQIAAEIASVRAEISGLPNGVPESDSERLQQLTAAMRARLSATRFHSYDVRNVELDQDSLRPTRTGFDMDVDVSASDVTRIKVAYLDAVRVEGQERGRHPGLLILDEPRQQDIDPTDYSAMLRYLAQSNDGSGQVIITSATPRGELADLLSPLNAHVFDLDDERLLRPEDDTSALDFA